jgi:hypothetical protein
MIKNDTYRNKTINNLSEKMTKNVKKIEKYKKNYETFLRT